MFDDEKIKIIETFPERDTILVIWIKILCQAGKTGYHGELSISERIPLTDETLSTLFNRPINSVRLALKTLMEFGMIELVTEKKLYAIPKWEKYQQTELAEHKRKVERDRQNKFRAKNKSLQSNDKTVCHAPVTLVSRSCHDGVTMDDVPPVTHLSQPCHAPEKEEEGEREVEGEKEKEEIPSSKNEEGGLGGATEAIPSEEVSEEPSLQLRSPSIGNVKNSKAIPAPPETLGISPELWNAWLDHRKSLKKPMSSVSAPMLFNKLEGFQMTGTDPSECLKQSIINGWLGVFDLKDEKRSERKTFGEMRRQTNDDSREQSIQKILRESMEDREIINL